MYTVYVLKSGKDNKNYYGFTTNIERRLFEHNSGTVASTKSRRPFEIAYFEQVPTLKLARKRERYFKSGFGRKYIKNRLESKS